MMRFSDRVLCALLLHASSVVTAVQQDGPAPVVRIGVLLPVVGSPAAGYASSGWWPRMGWYQALREINNKTDNVTDWLLPRTRIEFAFRDSKCEPGYAILLQRRSASAQHPHRDSRRSRMYAVHRS